VVTVYTGFTQSFVAAVTIPAGEATQTAAWEVSIGDCGTVNPATGNSTTFTATKSGSCRVRAYVMSRDNERIYTNHVQVTAKADDRDPEIAILIEQLNAEPDDTYQFEANVITPEGQTAKVPTWTITPGCGTINSSTGMFTAGKGGLDNCTVTASVTGISGNAITAQATVNVSIFKTAFVEKGTFMMGCNVADEGANCSIYVGTDARPKHQVTLTKNFNIGIYHVTVKQWRDLMGSVPESAEWYPGDNMPVWYLTWYEVQEFIEKLNAKEAVNKTGRVWRLPTEAEWEYAARGGKNWQTACGGNPCSYSGSNNLDDVMWYGGNSGGILHEVGTKAPNSLGLYDMSGNMPDLVADRWYVYGSSPETDPFKPHVEGGNYEERIQVTRGGGFLVGSGDVAVFSRTQDEDMLWPSAAGFRLVREAN